jgi:hypothetical protein
MPQLAQHAAACTAKKRNTVLRAIPATLPVSRVSQTGRLTGWASWLGVHRLYRAHRAFPTPRALRPQHLLQRGAGEGGDCSHTSSKKKKKKEEEEKKKNASTLINIAKSGK